MFSDPSFPTASLHVAGSPYTITYNYAGDQQITGVTYNYSNGTSSNSLNDTSKKLTVNPYAFTYQIGTASQTYGTAANLAGALGSTISTPVRPDAGDQLRKHRGHGHGGRGDLRDQRHGVQR